MFWDTSQFGLFSFSFFKFSYNWGRKKLINFHIDSPPYTIWMWFSRHNVQSVGPNVLAQDCGFISILTKGEILKHLISLPCRKTTKKLVIPVRLKTGIYIKDIQWALR